MDNFVEDELKLAGYTSDCEECFYQECCYIEDPDDCESYYKGYIGKSVRQLIEIFELQKHDEYSKYTTLRCFNRLVNDLPITPLNGTNDEWIKLGNGKYMNKRARFVFKDSQDGRAYNSNAKIFSDDNGVTWVFDERSKEYIDFPYDVPDEPERIIIQHE